VVIHANQQALYGEATRFYECWLLETFAKPVMELAVESRVFAGQAAYG